MHVKVVEAKSKSFCGKWPKKNHHVYTKALHSVVLLSEGATFLEPSYETTSYMLRRWELVILLAPDRFLMLRNGDAREFRVSIKSHRTRFGGRRLEWALPRPCRLANSSSQWIRLL